MICKPIVEVGLRLIVGEPNRGNAGCVTKE